MYLLLTSNWHAFNDSGLVSMSIVLYVQKKTWQVGKENDFFCHKNNSNVSRNPCISIIMIFTCCPLIFLCFRQCHRQRFFFSLFVVFAFTSVTQRFMSAGILFAQAKPLSKVGFKIIFSWYLRTLGSFFAWKKHWVPIFSSLERVLVICHVLGHSWQTNVIWIPVYFFIPNCQFST